MVSATATFRHGADAEPAAFGELTQPMPRPYAHRQAGPLAVAANTVERLALFGLLFEFDLRHHSLRMAVRSRQCRLVSLAGAQLHAWFGLFVAVVSSPGQPESFQTSEPLLATDDSEAVAARRPPDPNYLTEKFTGTVKFSDA
ncbi:hypothetical protein [Rhodopseudomonas palustris]|uniref:hypothetical protein n=1 Tax=Rhodopseudomonas palustris TaxID=1076 RepID=UPI0010580F94|nr:hypothetical protein [Rhodopseudomonas palustris]